MQLQHSYHHAQRILYTIGLHIYTYINIFYYLFIFFHVIMFKNMLYWIHHLTSISSGSINESTPLPWSCQACPSEIGRTSSNLTRDTYTLKYFILLNSLGFLALSFNQSFLRRRVWRRECLKSVVREKQEELLFSIPKTNNRLALEEWGDGRRSFLLGTRPRFSELLVSRRASVSSNFHWTVGYIFCFEIPMGVDPPWLCHTNSYSILKCPRESQRGVNQSLFDIKHDNVPLDQTFGFQKSKQMKIQCLKQNAENSSSWKGYVPLP